MLRSQHFLRESFLKVFSAQIIKSVDKLPVGPSPKTAMKKDDVLLAVLFIFVYCFMHSMGMKAKVILGRPSLSLDPDKNCDDCFGLQGEPGEEGIDGPDEISLWDLNVNWKCDIETEDIDGTESVTQKIAPVTKNSYV